MEVYGSIDRAFEDGLFHGHVCGAPLREPFELDVSNRTLLLSDDEPSSPPFGAVLYTRIQHWTGCIPPGLEVIPRGEDFLNLSHRWNDYDFALTATIGEDGRLSLSDGRVLAAGGTTSYVLDGNFSCTQSDCGGSSWVHYQGNLDIHNFGHWDSVRRGPIDRVCC